MKPYESILYKNQTPLVLSFWKIDILKLIFRRVALKVRIGYYVNVLTNETFIETELVNFKVRNYPFLVEFFEDFDDR